MRSTSGDDVPEVARPYAWHGVEFTKRSGNDLVADCPFCGKESHFFVDASTGQFVCASADSRCGRRGNTRSFLQQWCDAQFEETEAEMWREIAENRGLPESALRRWMIAWDTRARRWLVPVYSSPSATTPQDVRCWRPGKKSTATAGCKAGLWNGASLAKTSGRVYLCEGEWDGMAMDDLLRRAGSRDHCCVAVPGARTFKADWAELMQGREVWVMYDNDEDGRCGMRTAERRLDGAAKTTRFLWWPETLPEKYDVRDHVSISRKIRRPPATTLAEITGFMRAERPRCADEAEEKGGSGDPSRGGEVARERPATNPRVATVLKEFRRWLDMTPDLEMAVRATLAVAVSNQIPGDPVWMFLVGPSGSGKTEVLCAQSTAPDTLFQSSIHAKALVSGYTHAPGGKDPSMIPKMIGKTCVFKDFTEVISGPWEMMRETFSVLRGAYDGEVARPFGAGVMREYKGRFTLLAGVTNAIHSIDMTSLGERFVKFQLRPPENVHERLVSAVLGVGREDEKSAALRDVVSRFLDRDVGPTDPRKMIGEEGVNRISALANFVATVRSRVEWERFGGRDREMRQRPSTEVGSRLAKQLSKLAMALCIVDGATRVGEEQHAVVERVAFDTAIGFSLDIVEAVIRMGGEGGPIELAREARLPLSTMRDRLEELELLGILERERGARRGAPGKPGDRWRASRDVMEMWRVADVRDRHVEDAVEGRTDDGR